MTPAPGQHPDGDIVVANGKIYDVFSGRLPWAAFSPCRRYRYLLAWPTGVENDRIALGVFANPSVATPEALDPTLTRWLDYCRRWGFGWSYTGNVRAWRETNPKLVPPDPEAIGPCNDDWIKFAATRAELVLCGWGKLGGAQGNYTLELLQSVGATPKALKLNADGSPAHPLYLKSTCVPIELHTH
jgi:hypothetical protein